MASLPTSAADSRTRADALREALATRVVVADGAMGTMLQAQDPTLEDFENLEGCNEILNITRPDIVRSVHEEYFAVGVDCVETNTFGANHSAANEYEIADRIFELSESGARIAREVADEFGAKDGRQRWVLGSIGPGTKLPSLGHIAYDVLRDGYQKNAEGLLTGGSDALIVETTQDLLQTKSSIIGARRAMDALGVHVPLICSLAFETTGVMLLGSEIGAALTALEPLGIDLIGLNCSTGPDEMSEHLRYLARHSRTPLMCMPNAGLPVLTKDGAHFPLGPDGLADSQENFVRDYGLSLIGGCCGTTPEHLRAVVDRARELTPTERDPRPEPGAASLYQTIPFRQDTAYLAIGERTNANGSKKFREAMLEARWDDCVEMARDQIREGAHMLDLCVDYVGRDGVADMAELAGRFATASTLPIVLDSTELPVLRAGLEKLGGRAVLNSVNYEDGDGPESRFAQVSALAAEHGAALIALTIDEEGQARTVENKVAIAERLIEDLTANWSIRESDILIDTLTFTICTGQEESRGDGIATIGAIRELKKRHPDVQTTLGLSNISFGLNPAARVVLNSVFLDECVKAGLDSAIVHASKILPIARLEEEQVKVALDLIYDRRAEGYDPLQKLMELFEGVNMKSMKAGKAEELMALPLDERLQRRIIDGEKNGLEADLDEALQDTPALDIVNNTLLEGMKVVGELFGSGQMQLPFVLQSAEVMKSAVAHLEPHMEKSDDEGKGTIVLATVRGDVHDIGKNLVDIILSNNGYNVVNLGIKQPVSAILEAAEEHRADVIGMSGLLVKSTVIMKENLQELNQRKMAADFPVILGGAALTRAYVEQDLHEIYEGEVRYARDAFEGLRLMDALIGVKRGVPGAALPELKQRRVPKKDVAVLEVEEPEGSVRSDVSTTNPIPEPPFRGTRVIKGIPLKDYASWLDEGALFKGQWGLKQARTGDGPTYEELVETEGRPHLRGWLDHLQSNNLLEAAVVYGYFPCVSKGDDLVLLHEDGSERTRFTFPRQRRGRRLCLADFFRPEESGETDVIGLQIVTVGSRIGEATAELFAANSYRDYLELHGLSVQLAEALAEYWHARVRSELGFAGEDPEDVEDMFALKYRGARFSLGYGACPDLEDRAKIADLLQPERIGVHLSEEFQLHPEQSTDAIVIHHPEAKYFNAR
ncbi:MULTISPECIES: methionine synthase [Streptomyces]|uniref:Methionine synthase n=1 Tax=Streptomyces griseus subsp. griseus (strain JCM 4626 / CBS 651.72 / NBRC 13350 / KCC S-0626 / ISP 5235) TaxID=455632 RepID=B1W2Z4_STRGG|nr:MULTISPECIES: methionine synthase [Streptomyces]MYR53509.1 methionine synthase [Streptomyces sp. SID4928]MYT82884.1 methionine synthase [Streptomyces sp. SID8364]EGE45484.1 methionine synthase [Streptomyces sp. ACT-1]MBW3708358.1 methionine synthase [Streptomyces griseus]NEB54012.1 methionine synthase [Streptomyces griseus]